MNFIDSGRANLADPINLDHVISFRKDHAGSTTMITFSMSSGKTIHWKYYKNKANRDLDYEQLLLIALEHCSL